MVEGGAGIELYCDGGARGNPGEAAFGVVILRQGKVVKELYEKIGIATNNVAEYRGVIEGLRYLRDNPAAKANIYLDSQLVVRQLKGGYRVRNAKLKEYYLKAKKLQEALGFPVEFCFISRDLNKMADRLVNRALDS